MDVQDFKRLIETGELTTDKGRLQTGQLSPDYKRVVDGETKRKHEDHEYKLQKRVVQYLQLQYPHILFHSDLSGMYTDKITAGKNSALNPYSGHPDLMIYYRNRKGFSGLAIELKAEGVKIRKADGEYANEHITKQAYYLKRLSANGWSAYFAIGFDAARRLIDEYIQAE